MALSPADFAAYSRATGAPYPESPQERAELAPEVLAFRRGQLTQPEQQSNLPAILGGTALGLGALGAALAGTRRFARGTKTQSTPQRDLGIVRQAATGRTSGTTAPRTPPPPTPGTPPSSEGVAPSKVTAIPQATVDLTDLTQTDRPLPSGDPWTGEAGAPTPLIQGPISAQQNLQNFLGEPTLPYKRTDLPVARTPGSFLDFSKTASGEAAVESLINDIELKKLVSQQRRQEGAELGREAQRQMRIASAIETEADEYLAQLRQESLSQQAFGALQSGEDQMTGRTLRAAQRNEDLDIGQINNLSNQLGDADLATSLTTDGIPTDQSETGGRINELVDQAKRYLRSKEIDINYDYSAENTMQARQVAQRINEAAVLKNQADKILNELKYGAPPLSPVQQAQQVSKQQRAQLAAQGFAGEKLEQQLLENMQQNFPEGNKAMSELVAETKDINKIGRSSQLGLAENIGSVVPISQGDLERVGSAASGTTIRGLSRIPREDLESRTVREQTPQGTYVYSQAPRAGGEGVYGLEESFAPGAVRQVGSFEETDYGTFGREYTPAATRKPTETYSESIGKIALADLKNPYGNLSNEQLGELSMYGNPVDRYNAQSQLAKRESLRVSSQLRQLQLANDPGADTFINRLRQGLI
jgi:hypothetical protein